MSDLELLIERLSNEYPFITEVQKKEVLEHYKNTTKTINEIEEELKNKINQYLNNQNNEYYYKPLTNFSVYNIEGKNLHIHLIPKNLYSYMREFYKKYKNDARKKYEEFLFFKLNEAMYKVTEILKQNLIIEQVCASSLLVKKYEHIFKKFGFNTKELTQEEIKRLFPENTTEKTKDFKYHAFIDRDTLLQKYEEQLENNPSL